MDHLWLFGSRADDAKRGGDIDLYVETQETDMDRLYDKKVRFVSDMWNQMGEQKIDVIINALFNPTSLPIYKIAKETGILLV
jgi:predicted nucleotidyltransferase